MALLNRFLIFLALTSRHSRGMKQAPDCLISGLSGGDNDQLNGFRREQTMASDFEKKHSDSTISINSSRRSFLKRVGTLGAASLVAPWIPRTLAADALALNPSTGRIMPGSTPIKHVVIACQENRSFDEYYGFAPFVGSYGLPPGWTQPDGHGGQVAPYHFGNSITPDIAHDWRSIHSEIDNGAMDGFYITDGNNCMGYYDSGDLGYYYSLFNDYTLCVNYFCSMPSDTFPNRLYMA